ncbi:GerAB/ArcD/ProY family transporter [Salirhabdus salicampi]|uniref:GerAB/ArcD/ProY family transporter n=1 Tax=Salirhabdus salicampi TaxID=476102 RepID=UPI0020C2A9B4|nr:GerAB/ArcD/ProY family transporter [Salirhabdus salicampi]MCP8615596.1 spore germination protein [Salirhabdus salicampi]
MGQPIKDQFKVSPNLVFFLITSVQIGIGLLTFQSQIIEPAEQDAWMSVIIAAIATHFILWLIYWMLNKEKSDVIDIHKKVFGKWVGNLFNTILIVYFFLLSTTIVRMYIEIIQVWMFEELNTWSLALVIYPLIFYVITGGFRTVTGICFFGLVIPYYLILTLLSPLEFSHFHNLLPIFDHSIKDIFMSSRLAILSYLGFGTLLLFYPFIQKPETSQKWAHLGLIHTTFIYLLNLMITLSYYSLDYLKDVIWPTLGMWKIVELPFVERFEYIGIVSWFVVSLPNMCLTMWAASRGLKRMANYKQKHNIYLLAIISFMICLYLKDRTMIDKFSTFISNTGLILMYGYIPILCFFYLIRKKVNPRHEKS